MARLRASNHSKRKADIAMYQDSNGNRDYVYSMGVLLGGVEVIQDKARTAVKHNLDPKVTLAEIIAYCDMLKERVE